MIDSNSLSLLCSAMADKIKRAAVCTDGIWEETPIMSVRSTSGTVSVVVELPSGQTSGSTVTGLRLMDEDGNNVTQVTTAISRADGDDNGYSLQYTLSIDVTKQA